MARCRVLLVDDQELVLMGLERVLRRHRDAWEVEVAGGGRRAQDLLGERPFDVLVTDLNMPGHGGAELMEWCRANHPGTVRIVLSGHQDMSMIQAAARVAHRFLMKPCAPETLLGTLTDVARFQDLPGTIRDRVAATTFLPPGPVVAHRVKTWRQNDSAPQETFVGLVGEDPGLAAKALQLVNSAFFGAPRALVSPYAAAKLLDREKAQALEADPAPPAREALLRPLRERSLQAARTALAIVRAEGGSPTEQDLAYAGTLLAGAGDLILADAPEGEAGDPWGVAAHFLNLLGLPPPLLDLVGRIGNPGDGPASLALAAAHVACGRQDDAFLERAGRLSHVPSWNHLKAPRSER